MEVFHILIPSRDGRITLKTVLLAMNVARLMKKDSISWHMITGGFWLTAARYLATQDMVKEEIRLNGKLTGSSIRGFIVSDDIQILNSPEEIASMFMECDKQGYNIVGNYKESNGLNLVFNGENRYTDEELRNLKDDYVPIHGDCGAIDFYYGDIPIDYMWHMDVVDEATNFYRDNPQLKPMLATKVHLAHKVSWLRSTWVDYDKVKDIKELGK
jgi:hypothetical protein